ncbi:MAG TPA: Mur ligase family protein [Candidatus Limnocylindrales bacterium]|nr:Mur ligase family protein [Candidatus Limnocylindrales bacterium]
MSSTNIDRQQQTETPGCLNDRLSKIKYLGSLWLGKILISATRISGRGGTTLPGRVALKISPKLTSFLTGQLTRGSLIVTGTNGKTTTASLLTGILKNEGYRCIHNQSGSNMSWGVASALIGASSWRGKLTADFAVMEVDEGAFPAIVRDIQPLATVVTNIFRDQLDRYGEVDQIRDAIRRGLNAQPQGSFQIINADDPSLTGIEIADGLSRWTYGQESEPPETTYQNTSGDIKLCPRCHDKLDYMIIYFAHLGQYRCLRCGYKRPEPEVKLTGHTRYPDGSALLEIRLPDETLLVKYPLIGTYNVYNALAAIACAHTLAIPSATIKLSLEKAVPPFGRMELFELEGKTMIMALIKNPVGANEVLRTLLSQTGNVDILIAINDKIADGTDVSWLWDVDFELLTAIEERLSSIVVSGLRAWDMAVRLKYSCFDPKRIQVEENTAKALKHCLDQTATGKVLYLLPNYTAMLEMRHAMNQMGLGKPYWEG